MEGLTNLSRIAGRGFAIGDGVAMAPDLESSFDRVVPGLL